MYSLNEINEKFNFIYKNIDNCLNHLPTRIDNLFESSLKTLKDKNCDERNVQKAIDAAKEFSKSLHKFIDDDDDDEMQKAFFKNRPKLILQKNLTTHPPLNKSYIKISNPKASVAAVATSPLRLTRDIGTNVNIIDTKSKHVSKVIRIQSYRSSIPPECTKHVEIINTTTNDNLLNCSLATADTKQMTSPKLKIQKIYQFEVVPPPFSTQNMNNSTHEQQQQQQQKEKENACSKPSSSVISKSTCHSNRSIEVKSCNDDGDGKKSPHDTIVKNDIYENELSSLNTLTDDKKLFDVIKPHRDEKCYREIFLSDDDDYDDNDEDDSHSTSSEICTKSMSNEVRKIDIERGIVENFQSIYDLVTDTFQSISFNESPEEMDNSSSNDNGLEEIKHIIQLSEENIRKAQSLLGKYRNIKPISLKTKI